MCRLENIPNNLNYKAKNVESKDYCIIPCNKIFEITQHNKEINNYSNYNTDHNISRCEEKKYLENLIEAYRTIISLSKENKDLKLQMLCNFEKYYKTVIEIKTRVKKILPDA